MPDLKITQLAAVVAPEDTDLFVTVNGAQTKSTTLSQIKGSNIQRSFPLAEALIEGDVVKATSDGSVEKVHCGTFAFKEEVVSEMVMVEVSQDTFLLAFRDATDAGIARIAKVVDNNITYGTEAVFEAAVSSIHTTKLADGKALLTYWSDALNGPEARVATVSGTAGNELVYGPAISLGTADVDVLGVEQVGDDRAMILLSNSAAATGPDDSKSLAVIAKASIDTLTLGVESEYAIVTNNVAEAALVSTDLIANTEKMLVCCSQPSLKEGISKVAEINDTTITWGADTLFHQTDFAISSLTVTELSADRAALTVSGGRGDDSKLMVANITGTTIAWTNPVNLGARNGQKILLEKIATDRAVMADSRGAQIMQVSPTNAFTIGEIKPIEGNGSIARRPFAMQQLATEKVVLSYDTFITSNAIVGVSDGSMRIEFDTRREHIGIMAEAGGPGEIKRVIVDGIYKSPVPITPGKYEVSIDGRIQPYTGRPGYVCFGTGVSADEVVMD